MAVGNVTCFICDKSINTTYRKIITAFTSYTNISLSKKLQNFVGNDFIVIVNEEDKVCESCIQLFDLIDKLEFELKQVNNILSDHLMSKYNICFLNEASGSKKECYKNSKELGLGTKNFEDDNSIQLSRITNQEVNIRNKTFLNKEYFCNICKIRIIGMYTLRKHISENHVLKEVNQDSTKSFKCYFCFQYFSNEKLCESHVETYHLNTFEINELEKEALNKCLNIDEKEVKRFNNNENRGCNSRSVEIKVLNDSKAIKKQISCSKCNEPVENVDDRDINCNNSFFICSKCGTQFKPYYIEVSKVLSENEGFRFSITKDIGEHLYVQSDNMNVELPDEDSFNTSNKNINSFNNFEQCVSCDIVKSSTNEIENISDSMQNNANLESTLPLNKEVNYKLNLIKTDNQESWNREYLCNLKRDQHNDEHVEKLCKICNKYFKRVSTFIRHNRLKHRDNLVCSICQAPFMNLEKLIAHEKEHNKKFMCKICCKILKSRCSLKTHLITMHTRDYSYICETCGQGFIYSSALNEHKGNHSAELRYICDICGKGFRLHDTYYKHRNLHDNPYPKQCEVCHQYFRSSSRLSEHKKKKHTLERPYKCSYCPLSFNISTLLKTHLYKHTRQYPYMCVSCKKGFPSRFKYALHMAKIHKDDSLIKNRCPNNKEIEQEWLKVSRKD